jgi:hypothetical protein
LGSGFCSVLEITRLSDVKLAGLLQDRGALIMGYYCLHKNSKLKLAQWHPLLPCLVEAIFAAMSS